MIPAYKKKSNAAAGICLAILIGAVVLAIISPGEITLSMLLLLCFGVALICSCWFYLKAKGRSGWWTLLLGFQILGLIIIALLKDRAKDGASNVAALDLPERDVSLAVSDRQIRVEEKRSLYDVIGVRRTASAHEIRAACLALGERFRTSTSADSLEAASKFKEIEATYEILGDPEKRAAYDSQFEAKQPATMPVSVIGIPSSPNVSVAEPQNYFVRHWRGDLSLATSYWVNGTLIATVLPLIVIAVLSEYVKQAESLRFTALIYVLSVIAGLALWLWGVVGIYRCSDNHVARGGSRTYANLAKVIVVLGTLSVAAQLSNSYVPMMKEMTLILFGEDPIGSYKATVLSDGKSILIRGTLREGSAKEIEKLLDSAPAVSTLVLSSNGGRLLEAKLLAMAVSKRGLNTYVESICVSACTFVFLAGRDRAATHNAKIGFHTPSFPGSDPETLQAGLRFMMDVYRQAGLPKPFLDKVSNTPSTDMWYPTRDELIAANVITRLSFGGESTVTFTEIRSKQDLLLLLRGIALVKAYEKRFPDFVQKATDRAWKAKEQGGSDDQILSAMRVVTAEYYPVLIAQADDASLESFARLLVDQFKAARSISYGACTKLMENQLNIFTALPKQYAEREQAWQMHALESQANGVARRNQQAIDTALRMLRSTMNPALVDAFANPAEFQGQPNLRCDSTIAVYDAALSLPPTQKAAALEGLLKGEP